MFYLQMAIDGVRSEEVASKIKLHLQRFQTFYEARYGQDYIRSWVKRDVVAWQKHLEKQLLATSTINRAIWHLSPLLRPGYRLKIGRFSQWGIRQRGSANWHYPRLSHEPSMNNKSNL